LAAAENRDEFHALAALAEEAGVSMLWLGAQSSLTAHGSAFG
jgi:hypothetical protein